jgi:hypothetical protein
MNTRAFLSVALIALPACGAAYRTGSPPPRGYPAEYGGAGVGAAAAPMSAPGVSVMSKNEASFSDDKETGDAVPISTGVTTVSTVPANVPMDQASANQPKPTEMLDTEAHLTIQVEKVSDSSVKLRELVKQYGGTITNDTSSDSGGSTYATFAMRIPADKAEAFLNSSEALGHVTNRQVTTRDVGKEYFDAQLLLQNLEKAMARYEEILGHAKDVKEILTVEAELTRLRGQIEQVKGNLRWLKDRVSRATIFVNLTATHADTEPTFNPSAKLYPGFRFTQMTDFREDGRTGFIGGGFSLQFARAFSIDIEGLRQVGGDTTNGLDLFLLTMGGEFYSDFLGGGRRRFLNPYLGFRGGYARFLGKNEAVAGGTFGLELFKTKQFVIDTNVRIYALFGSSVGAHVGVQPAIGFNIAF